MGKNSFLKNYGFSVVLVGAIVFGSAVGLLLKERAVVLKPFGTVFLNLLFTLVIPLVFFSLSSAIARMRDGKRLGKILILMIAVFLVTGLISSSVMIAAVKIFPPADAMKINIPMQASNEQISIGEQVAKALTVGEFGDLLSKRNMLALILFSILVGFAVSASGQKGKAFADLLESGNAVMAKALSFVMLYAPIGLGAYFAYLVGVFGPTLLGTYFKAMTIYYPVAIGYFLIAFSVYAYFAGRGEGVRRFWKNILPASLTACATGSSVATIPVNLEAAERIGIPEDIREVVIPIGATIHMEGSCLAAVLKIAILFGLFGMPFTGFDAMAKAVLISLMAGVVISGIPSGGVLGEIIIISLYGFPIEALPLITMVGTLVDPPATMVNAIGDNVSSMMIARIIEGKDWMTKKMSHREINLATEFTRLAGATARQAD